MGVREDKEKSQIIIFPVKRQEYICIGAEALRTYKSYIRLGLELDINPLVTVFFYE